MRFCVIQPAYSLSEKGGQLGVVNGTSTKAEAKVDEQLGIHAKPMENTIDGTTE